MKNRTNKIGKYILMLFISILVLVCGYFILGAIIKLVKNPTDTVAIKEGTISQEETVVGYIIRDETIVQGENYKNGMEQIIDEGQKVAKNEPVFRYYSQNEDSLKKQIDELNVEIQTAMKQNVQKGALADTKLLDTQIADKLKEINKLNSMQAVQESKRTISNLVTKKAEIIGESSPQGSYLKELINKRREYETKMSENSEYINSPKSGILSYKIDGLENILGTNDFSKYNKEFFNELNLKTNQIIATSTEQGKIVDNFNCYIAFTTKTKEGKNAKIGDKISIVLPSAKTITAEISYIIEESEEETTVIIKFIEGAEELLSYRKISVDIIWWKASGYKVPNSAIITENDLNYVIRTRNGYLNKVLVKVGKKTELYTVVSNYSASEIKDLTIEEGTRTSVVLYDEIVLNPTQEMINSIN